jgi:hypothetical protein
MEKFALTLQSKTAVQQHIAERRLMRYEQDIMDEILAVIEKGDVEQLAWFAGFGDSFRQILMNVNEYRRALGFGFTEVAFNQYGWLAAPKFLDFEEIKLEQSSIRIGRGPNGIWAYALSCNYGTAGNSGPLCVFCRKYPNREAVLNAALADMRSQMTKYLGNSDTMNYKQDVLQRTLKAIAVCEVNRVQLTLF